MFKRSKWPKTGVKSRQKMCNYVTGETVALVLAWLEKGFVKWKYPSKKQK